MLSGQTEKEIFYVYYLYTYLYSDGGVADLRLKNKFLGAKHEVL